MDYPIASLGLYNSLPMQPPLSPTNPALVGDDYCDIIGYRNNERQLPITSKAASSLTIS